MQQALHHPPHPHPHPDHPAEDDALFAALPDDNGFDPGDEPAAPAQRAAAANDSPPAADETQLVAWIEAIAGQDERALAALYDATLSRVYGLVLRIVRRPAWADEVVEDTYFQVWRQALRYDAARGRALTWLLGMARSRAIDALRREARFDHVSLDEHDEWAPGEAAAAADAGLAGDQGQALLQRALAGLAAQPRQLLALAFFRGLSHEEIAEQMALPLGTVKSQIRRALIALREVLGDAGRHALPV
jgi:RNA polymerase sigma-70 factor (ECF subfamily)